MEQDDILAYIRENNLIGIRGGSTPRGFLNIWMVVVDGRIFARSWGLQTRSWYTAFLAEGVGAIQCGEQQIAVLGKIPQDLDALGEKINLAYLQKYTSEHNRPYAQGICTPEHMATTLEIVPIL